MDPLTRRDAVRAMVGTLGIGLAAAAVAACRGTTGPANPPGSDPERPSSRTTEAGTLTRVGDIPVGGGVIFAEQKVVITQPQADRFEGFSAICTHQGCTVRTVEGGTINCPCHGSRFSVLDGTVQAGPAPRPLPREPIKVADGAISLA